MEPPPLLHLPWGVRSIDSVALHAILFFAPSSVHRHRFPLSVLVEFFLFLGLRKRKYAPLLSTVLTDGHHFPVINHFPFLFSIWQFIDRWLLSQFLATHHCRAAILRLTHLSFCVWGGWQGRGGGVAVTRAVVGS